MDKFLYGVATSSYQIEGAAHSDGRQDSIWDAFCRIPGKIVGDNNGEVACDHYNLYKPDIQLMKDLNVDAYRFSLAWPRLIPDGDKTLNLKGFDFYHRIIDQLLEQGIQPWITLYHWDLPQALQERGGWVNRNIVDWFLNYADKVFDAYGDKVHNFFVLNEPSVACMMGHLYGRHAPGISDKASFLAAAHHQNLVHGSVIKLAREKLPNAKLGSAYTYFPVRPLDKENDLNAAHMVDALWNRVYFDPVFKGQYSEILANEFLPYIQPGDMETIRTPVDFVGINHYNPAFAASDPTDPFHAKKVKNPALKNVTDIGWPVEADALEESLLDLAQRYGNPEVYISENGACYNDEPNEMGEVNDKRRIDYYESYLQAVKNAKQKGSNVQGYFAWSFMDNFEWSYGFSKRFGLIHVDYKTLQRTPKASYYWYQKHIARNQPS